MITLNEAIAEATLQLAPSPTARRDAELLLQHAIRLTKADLLTHPDREITALQLSEYRAAIARRAQHEPVQHITGTQEFYGRSFIVSRLVLIPRPETEHLVEAALAIRPQPRHILDIGTGSGILAITFALELPATRITATDISPDTLAVAQQNAHALGTADRIRFLVSDLFAAFSDALPEDVRFDCIVSNPPYVSTSELLEPQVRDYEPAAALYAGDDGLAIYRRLVPQAFAHLEPGGHLLLEIGHGQREALHHLLAQTRFGNIRFIDDLQGIPRAAIAQKS
jgi:release factor glutamine methyltransferase